MGVSMLLPNELKRCMVVVFSHIASELEDVCSVFALVQCHSVYISTLAPKVFLFLQHHVLKLQGLLRIT